MAIHCDTDKIQLYSARIILGSWPSGALDEAVVNSIMAGQKHLEHFTPASKQLTSKQ
jgi:hypothetical protein